MPTWFLGLNQKKTTLTARMQESEVTWAEAKDVARTGTIGRRKMTKTERVVWDDMLLALKFVDAFHEELKKPPILDCFYVRSETRGRVQLAIEAAEKEEKNV